MIKFIPSNSIIWGGTKQDFQTVIPMGTEGKQMQIFSGLD